MRMSIRGVVAASVLGGLALVPAAAHADGFAVDRFDPAEQGSEWFVLDSLDLRGHMRPALGVVADWGYRPLVENAPNGDVQYSIVRNQVVMHAAASLVMWDRLRLGLDVPIQVFVDHGSGTPGSEAPPPPSSATTLGDIRLGLDVRLFGEYGGPITGALGAEVYLPTGDAASYSGDGNVRVAPHVMVAGDLGPIAYGAKVGVTIRGLDTTVANVHVGSDLLIGGSLGLRVAEKRLVIGPEIFGSSVLADGAFLTKRGTPLEGLFGAHYTFVGGIRLGAGISTGLTEGYGTPERRGLLSLEWSPEIVADRDGDGVPNDLDACPDIPGVGSDDPTTNGCPPPPPAPAPAPPPVADRDGDGVPDAVDACPDVAGVPTDDPKTNGCPSDRDHDGVLDDADACPDVPGLKTSDPKTNGCPDPDRDKDGIPNDVDACPDQPGKPNPDPKKNGCPTAYVDVVKKTIQILDQVKFATASSKIVGKDSDDVLAAVAEILSNHPEIKMVSIEGHTDDRGAADMNKRLSAARAASVVKWLTDHGVQPTRLKSQGFGFERPLVPNDSDEGRTQNRRVEFHIEAQP
jgi:OmpA-OmpF porin, OOP family